MRIPPSQLLDGVIACLRGEVLPDVQSRFGRSQLFAAIDVLQNLRNRVVENPSFAAEEIRSTLEALARAAESLAERGAMTEAEELRTARQSIQASELPLQQETAQRMLGHAFALLGRLGPEVSGEARKLLGAHLAAQSIRDVLPLKPSLLREISEG
jgi:hypothetical protein